MADVGADIESLCAKCGDVWHVVVAKVGERIAKVQCKQCGAQHRHKPPGATPARTPTAPRTRKKAVPPPPPRPEPDTSRPIRRYTPTEAYQTGDRVQHPTFGMGVAGASPGPGKIEVFFKEGPRVLAQAKAASTLAPRSPHGDGG
jgi:hypothetical protein